MTRHALAPLVRRLAAAPGAGPHVYDLGDRHRLVVGRDRAAMTAMALAGWRTPPVLSRSAAGDLGALLAVDSLYAGLDMETRPRIAANIQGHDRWLSAAEQAIVRCAADPLLEIGCRWVLREAYGKAVGVGLALPLPALVFGCDGGRITVAGTAAPAQADGWRFTLSGIGEALFATASRRA